ncbi:Glyco_hydro_57 domain-containing protein [Candidatus Hydrogenisulfobacillus filiaventi]|uniref:Glyco_hydro_57 domain-containing protein n=1 Tax=Candidatus Hydrogenisulfobacillus filiaventi TaxID=2707344 RepID=A0A6F8ZD72_9FIRM|nr:glycoside hydrolase family 57 protein [Bacillota bacterium]CAB1127634.1 Glyco_hydro_57 domain-containing protein [Candidatus Hydrogenisulfobacillus filiaventi]
MAQDLAIYVVMHQPRRLRLPAATLTPGMSAREMAPALFDEEMNARYLTKVAETSYRPALAMFHELAAERGLRLSLGISWSLVVQLERWAPDVITRLGELLALPGVELVGVEPYHSFLSYLDIKRFQRRMSWMRDHLAKRFGRQVTVTDTTEMMMNREIYLALDQLGFQGAVLDGRPQVMRGREPTRVFDGGGQMRLLARHVALSDDVGYRFTDRNWDGFPLLAPTYAHWIADTPGDFVMVGWDFETFGEHHRRESGIFEFMRHLPESLAAAGVRTRTLSEVIARHPAAEDPLPPPVETATWAGIGDISFFLGNPAQERVFRLMHHAYHTAVLNGDPELVDLALWLLQSDHLHLIQWYGRFGPEAEVSAYFTPDEWWPLGNQGIVNEIARVYEQFVGAVAGRPARRAAGRHAVMAGT